LKAYFIRHAEKKNGDYFNPVLGHNDQPINNKGRRASRRLYGFLRDKNVSQIYVSSYRRSRQTIRFAANKLQIEPILDPRLNEIDTGCAERLTDTEIKNEYPDVWRAYLEQDRDFRFPDGETGTEAQERAASFLRDIESTDKNIVAVSHDGLLRALVCHILDIPVYTRYRFKMDLCGIVELEWKAERTAWLLVRCNHAVL